MDRQPGSGVWSRKLHGHATAPGASFWRNEQGAATVEHAAMLLGIVAALFLVIDSLGVASRGTFSHLGGAWGPATVAQRSADRVATEGTGPSWARLSQRLSWPPLKIAVGVGLLGVLVARRYTRRPAAPSPAELAEATYSPPPDAARYVAKRQQILRLLALDVTQVLRGGLCVQHIMSHDPLTAPPSMSLNDARELMKEGQVRHLLVVDRQGKLLGVVSDRDLHCGSCRTVRDVMTPKPLTICPDQPLLPAVTLMLEKQISSLPVERDGHLVGIVTTTDIVMTLQCTVHLVRELSNSICLETKMGPVTTDLLDPYPDDALAAATCPPR